MFQIAFLKIGLNSSYSTSRFGTVWDDSGLFGMVWDCLGGKDGVRMPLTMHVWFKAKLRVGNRIQIPRAIRWEHRLEPDQVLRVSVEHVDLMGGEVFYGRMNRDGRLTMPRLVVDMLCQNYELKSLVGEVFNVSLDSGKA